MAWEPGKKLVGRDVELSTLEAAAERASRRQAGLVLVEGEAGIGKSALALWLIGRQSAGGGAVLAGACAPGTGRDLPFHGWAGVVRGLGAAGTLIFGEQAGRSRGQVLAAITDEILRKARSKLTTVVLEDTHWADDSTLDLLDYLVRSARDERLLVVATARVPDRAYERVKDRLRELGGLPQSTVLHPRRLSETEVRAQLESLVGGAVEEDAVAATFRRTEGIPFLVEELVAAGGDGADAQDLVGYRLKVLGEDARRVVDTVAATVARPSSSSAGGGQVDDELLFAAAGLDAHRFDAAVTEAITAGVLTAGSGGRVGFRHALLQEAAAAALPPRRRRELHRRWAEAITAAHPHGAGALIAELAEHWAGAGDDERALPAYLDAAAEARRVFADRERLRLLLAAIDRWPAPSASTSPRSGTDLAAVLSDAAELAVLVADHRLARDLVERGRGLLGEPEDRPRRAWFDLVELWVRAGEHGGVPMAEIRTVADDLRQQPPNRQVAVGLLTLAGHLPQHGQIEEAERALDEAWPLVDTLDDDELRFQATELRAHLLSAAGSYSEALDWCEEARALADRFGGLRLRAASRQIHGVVLWESGDLRRAIAAGEESIELLGGRRPGPEPEAWALEVCNQVSGLLDLGRWDEAEERLADVEAASGVASLYWLDWSTWLRCWIDVARGRPEPVEHFTDEPDRRLDSQQMQWAATRVGLAVETLTHLGRFEEARRIAAPLLAQDRLGTSIPAFVLAFLAEASRNEVEAAIHAHDTDAAIVSKIATLAAKVPANNPMLRAYADQTTADLACLKGAATPGRWRLVADQWERLGYRYWHAWALLRAGTTAAEHGDSEGARMQLTRALGISTELGAVPLQDRIREAAGQARIRIRQNSTGGAEDLLGLTPRELEVLALLHDGASNRSIAEQLVISEKTVSVHVSHLISKLNAGSRGEAVAAARRLGLLEVEQRSRA